jgi:hypothetical protein
MDMKSRALLTAMFFAFPAASASASSLRGSHASMVRQHKVAVKNDYTFLRTAKQVREFAASDRLEDVTSTATYLIEGVSFPFARPVVKLFIERLAQQYVDATGSPLVVTSLTRPTSLQPSNASPLSVHPAGMAVDLRVPADASARSWLEQTLLSLEDKGLLDVTREHKPSHYHVAVFPEAYATYVAGMAKVATETITNVVNAPEAVAAAVTSATKAVAAPSRAGDSTTFALVALFSTLAALLITRGVQLSRAKR